jgi:hypothetical protein
MEGTTPDHLAAFIREPKCQEDEEPY